jgi:hypothetical protein
VLGICGIHVDDLLVAGDFNDKRFATAMSKLEKALLFGSRKSADDAPMLYTGLQITQIKKGGQITVSQKPYSETLTEVSLKQYPPTP